MSTKLENTNLTTITQNLCCAKLKIMEEYIKVDATTNLEILCTCPYCGALEDVLDDVRECLRNELSASYIDQ